MPFKLEELQKAYGAYRKFKDGSSSKPHHDRYIFPFFSGSYFAYRKVDVLRVVAITKAAAAATNNNNPSYLDVGCGYGDFLAKIRNYLPSAIGIEKEGGIFYAFQREKPEYIKLADIETYDNDVDVAFIGWMEPGTDFRRKIAKHVAKCIITTFDAGGQCGIGGGCEYDEFGFERIAMWRTPSWIDVNAELMNKYYTPSLTEEKKERLSKLRTAHNFWYVYCRPETSEQVRAGLKSHLIKEKEEQMSAADTIDRFDFESVLDECGFHYNEELASLIRDRRLWETRFD